MSITAEQAKKMYAAGRDMRRAQKVYFSMRTDHNLKVAKDYECRFDKILDDCERHLTQGSLI